MKRTKCVEILKVTAVAVLSIGIMSAAFIGFNAQAFADATNNGHSVPITITHAASASTVAQGVAEAPEGFQSPTLVVGEVQENNPSILALCPEDAAQIGAMYVWDMFGECLDGMYVDMWYQVWPSHTRAYWFGHVAESKEAFMNSQFLYSFLIDAVTGERIDITRIEITYRSAAVQAALNEQVLRGDYGRNVDGTGDTIFDVLYNIRTSQQMPELFNEQVQAAKELAQRHFVGTEVVSAEFVSFGIAGLDLDEDGNLVITSYMLTFNVTDSTGRIANVAFNEETGALLNISTQMNDVIPSSNTIGGIG